MPTTREAEDESMTKLRSFPSIRWAFNVRKWSPSREEVELGLSCIQREEKQRVLGFVYKKDLKPALIGRLMLRKCLSESLGMPYEGLRLERTEKGKPVLSEEGLAEAFGGRSSVAFDVNISHQGDFCVLAGEGRPKVGVDVMRFEYSGGRSLEDFFDLMKRQFSRKEWEFIRFQGSYCSDRDKLRRFIRLWCLKESYVKAEGVGIGFDLQRISFNCPSTRLNVGQITGDSLVHVDGEPLEEWVFKETLLDDNHCVSVAFQQSDRLELKNTGDSIEFPDSPSTEQTIFKDLDFQELMKGAIPLSTEVDQQSWELFSKKQESPRS